MRRALALLLAALFAAAASSLPALTGRVVDGAGVISPLARALLAAKLKALEDRSGVQVAVATVPSLDGEAIEPYATRLFDAWALGRRDRNDGALILVAPADRRKRIEVGPGLASRIPNAAAARIVAEDMLPLFRAGTIEGGIAAGVDRVVSLVSPAPVQPAPVQPVLVQPVLVQPVLVQPEARPAPSLPKPTAEPAAERAAPFDVGVLLAVGFVMVGFAVVMAVFSLPVRRRGLSGPAASTGTWNTDPGWQTNGGGASGSW